MKRIHRLLKHKYQQYAANRNSSLRLEPLESRLLLSVADHLRVTEIMYKPADPTPAEIDSGYVDNDLFEYIELTNTGATVLDLTGVTFAEVGGEGIIFDFSGSNVTSLASGEYVLVVRNQAAFTARYGAGLAGQIAGEYTGQIAGDLDNGGE